MTTATLLCEPTVTSCHERGGGRTGKRGADGEADGEGADGEGWDGGGGGQWESLYGTLREGCALLLHVQRDEGKEGRERKDCITQG